MLADGKHGHGTVFILRLYDRAKCMAFALSLTSWCWRNRVSAVNGRMKSGMREQRLERMLQRLGPGGLTDGDGELDKAEIPLVAEDVEHGDRLAAGVLPLLADLADGGDRDGHCGVGPGHEPAGEGVAGTAPGRTLPGRD